MLDTTSLMSITYKSFTCHHFPCRLSGVHLKTQELLAHKTQCNNSECGEERQYNTNNNEDCCCLAASKHNHRE